jgi:hypothetical protein
MENPRGLVVISDEITGWVLGMNEYKGGKGSDRQFWLSAWSGEPVKVDRKGNREEGSVIVPHPFLNVLGGIQPDMLQLLKNENSLEDGFLHLIAFSWPEEVPWSGEIGRSPSEEAEKAWEFVVGWLLRAEAERQPDGTEQPRLVRPTADADLVMRHWYRGHAAEHSAENFQKVLAGPWSKMRSYYFRLCLVLQHLMAACDGVEPEAEIHLDENAATGAIALADYFKSHARVVYPRLQDTAEDNRAERTLGWIQGRGGNCQPRDLIARHLAKKMSEARLLLADLADRGLGKLKVEKVNGRDVTTFYANKGTGSSN